MLTYKIYAEILRNKLEKEVEEKKLIPEKSSCIQERKLYDR